MNLCLRGILPIAAIMLLFGTMVPDSRAQPAPPPPPPPPQTDLSKFNFTVGVGTFMLKKGDSDVRTATSDNGVIRITDEQRYLLGIWLTSTLPFDAKWFGMQPGAFVGVQLNGDNRLLSSYAFGLSFASAAKSSSSAPLVFQLGYGFTQVQKLADGYTANLPLPAGANQPLLKKETVGALVMMVSTRF